MDRLRLAHATRLSFRLLPSAPRSAHDLLGGGGRPIINYPEWSILPSGAASPLGVPCQFVIVVTRFSAKPLRERAKKKNGCPLPCCYSAGNSPAEEAEVSMRRNARSDGGTTSRLLRFKRVSHFNQIYYSSLATHSPLLNFTEVLLQIAV